MNTTQWLAHWRDQLRVKQAAGEYTDWLRYRLDEAENSLANGVTLSARELPRQHNGFIREGVLRRHLERGDEAALAYCLVCLNDSVASLRELARGALEQRLVAASAESLLANLDLLLDLQRKMRADHSVALASIQERMGEPALRPTLLQALPSLSGREARFVFSTLMAENNLDAELLGTALAHPDPTLRTQAMDALGKAPANLAGPLWRRALMDRSGRLRAKALYALLKGEPDAAELHSWLETALLDSSPAVRDLARWAAPRHGVDAPAVVRRALEQLPKDRTHWHGVLGQAAELRMEEAVPLAHQALATPLPSVRRKGLQVLMELAPEQASEASLVLLADAAPGVIVAALLALKRLRHPAFEPAVRAEIARRAVEDIPGSLHLILMLPAGAQSESLLDGLCNAAEDQRELWLQAFQSWRQRWRPNRYWESAAQLKARLEGLRDRQLIPEEELTALIRAL
ncbi:hypothetical protein [Pseudomonas sp. zfem005]|uniref:hypothetical protein n=1 Tax=Pseudomonas sp. zfem005 TaxID=3078200 RepID=UPI00292903F9|nr:hypothetical protein [Pseudomonas sp. zfem005]MDU9413373.1 hypothetical protein [Pseudomonas sp. zfem005]